MIKVVTVMIMYKICDSDFVCEKYDKHLAVVSAQHK